MLFCCTACVGSKLVLWGLAARMRSRRSSSRASSGIRAYSSLSDYVGTGICLEWSASRCGKVRRTVRTRQTGGRGAITYFCSILAQGVYILAGSCHSSPSMYSLTDSIRSRYEIGPTLLRSCRALSGWPYLTWPSLRMGWTRHALSTEGCQHT